MIYDMFIIGAGPAGLTAALYGARAGLSVLVVDAGLPGGQLNQIDAIENYPGFPDGIDGFTLAESFSRQARKWGAEIRQEEVVSIVPEHGPWQIKTNKQEYTAKTVIAAAGAHPSPLGVKGEKEFFGKGVSYCGTCDGPLYRNKTVAVIGGGNTALQEAEFLAKFVNKLYIIHRRDGFRAQQAIVERIQRNERAALIMNSTLKEISGDDLVNTVTIVHNDSGEEERLAVAGVFIFVGYTPNTKFCEGIAMTDDSGRLLTDGHYQTATPGLYAIGDVRSKEVFQIANAVGEGAEVCHYIQQYIKEQAL